MLQALKSIHERIVQTKKVTRSDILMALSVIEENKLDPVTEITALLDGVYQKDDISKVLHDLDSYGI